MRRSLPHIAAIFALLTAGCVKYETTINVNDDGSGFLEMVVAIDAEAVSDLSSMFGEDLGGEELEDAGAVPGRDELCADTRLDPADAGPNATVEDYDEGSFCGSRVHVEFGPGDDVAASIADVMGAADTSAGEIVLRKEPDGGWRFELDLDLGDAGLDEEGVPPEMMEGVLGDASITFDVRLPGKPVDHNATSVDGNRFHWDISITDGQGSMFAVTEPGEPDSGSNSPISQDEAASGLGGGGGDDGGSSALWWIVGIVAALAVAGGIAFLVMRNRGSGAAPAMAAGAPAPGAWAAPGIATGAPDPAGGADAGGAAGAATGGPTWDDQRQAWVQYDAGRGGWLVFDEASQQWSPMT
ncbi:MAG: hypothetical protein KDB21_16775 [Acidimicrobiales bacterium]|nr:hypothetical protein [Acidimicrobiales bacterium]